VGTACRSWTTLVPWATSMNGETRHAKKRWEPDLTALLAAVGSRAAERSQKHRRTTPGRKREGEAFDAARVQYGERRDHRNPVAG
jgi:hypothetical protein